MIPKLLIALFFSLPIVCPLNAQQPKAAPEEQSFSVAVHGEIEHANSGDLKADVDVGTLPAGKRGSISLSLINTTLFDLPIHAMTTSCSCLRAVAQEDIIPAGGKVDIELRIEVPKTSRSAAQQLRFNITYADNALVEIALNYRLAGLISFPGSGFSTTAQFGEKAHRFRIPVLATEPIVFGEVLATADKSLGEIKLRGVAEGNEMWIECELELDPSSQVNRVGSIYVQDPKSGDKASIHCLVAQSQAFAVAPEIVRFTELEPSKKTFQARAIFKLDNSLIRYRKLANGSQQEELPPAIDWSAEFGKLYCDLNRIGPGIYRVNFTYVESEKRDEQSQLPVRLAKIECRLKTGKEVLSKTLRVAFE